MKILHLLKTLILIFLLSSCGSGDDKASDIPLSELTFEFPISKQQVLALAMEKYERQATLLSPSKGFIREAENDEWRQQNWKDWTDGFFPGVLWQLAIIDEKFLTLAQKWTLPLESHKDFDSHDLGFIFNNSYGKALRLTGEEQYASALEFSANHLAKRYSYQVKGIRSWDFGSYQYPIIMDNMMNLDLLWFSSNEFNYNEHFQIAEQHATTTLNEHIRENGSSFHLVDFSPNTGESINKVTVQGFADDSTWARGQSWGIYGFTRAYQESNNASYLATAESMADFFIENLPSDGVPAWDFDLSANQNIKDSSAASIAASALWQLSKLTNSTDKMNAYQQASIALIDNLLNDEYLDIDSNTPALLKKASGNVPSNKEVETSLIYADYYFVEAVMLQLGDLDSPS